MGRSVVFVFVLVLGAAACSERVIEGEFIDDFGSGQTPESGDDESEDESTGETSVPPPRVVFVNFDGPELTAGVDDARTDSSTLASVYAELERPAPYPAASDIPAVMATLRASWSGINVEFSTERPAGGTYTMVVVTPSNPTEMGSHTSVILDCDDDAANGVVFAFSEGFDGVRPPEVVAASVSRAVGFSFGLDVVDNPSDFMSDTDIPGSAFVDACSPIGADADCGEPDTCAAGFRNTHAQLIESTFGR